MCHAKQLNNILMNFTNYCASANYELDCCMRWEAGTMWLQISERMASVEQICKCSCCYLSTLSLLLRLISSKLPVASCCLWSLTSTVAGSSSMFRELSSRQGNHHCIWSWVDQLVTISLQVMEQLVLIGLVGLWGGHKVTLILSDWRTNFYHVFFLSFLKTAGGLDRMAIKWWLRRTEASDFLGKACL